MTVSAPPAKLYPLVGRDPEIDALSAFLNRSTPAGCLVFSGEPGIGKTTLWQLGLEMASREGFRVLSTRASLGEAGLLFAALADLMDGIEAAVLDQVPRPQMEAVDVALRRAVPGSVPPDSFAISAGFLAAVRALATESKPLIAIDDVQWLDPSSADCLLFMARRITAQPVRFLLSRRSGQPSELERALDPIGVKTVDVQGLSVGAVARLLSERFGLALPRRLLHRLYETSQGNPLFALELGRTIHEGGLPDIGSDLPIPKLVDDAFGARVSGVGEASRRALLAVALSAGLTRSELGLVVEPTLIDDAVASGLLVVDRSRVRSSHPMLAAAARKQSTAAERRDLHGILAGVVSDPVLSARHLALATFGTDTEVAETVSAAAHVALVQGAAHEAEELAAHALRLTPPGEPEASDRLLDLARCHLGAGDLAGATAVLRGKVGNLPPGRPRALAHLMLGEAADGATEEAELDLAIAEAGQDRELYGIALCRKAVLLSSYRVERLIEAEALAKEARCITEGTAEEGRGRLALGWALLMRGRPLDDLRQDSVEVRPGVNLFDTAVDRPVSIRRAFRGELDMATEIMVHLVSLADTRGDPRSRIGMAIQLGEFALRRGDVHVSQEFLDELDQWTAVDEMRIVCARLKAVRAALRGDSVEVDRLAEFVFDESVSDFRATWDYLEVHRAQGLVHLLNGDHRSAVDHFQTVWRHCRKEGVDDPGAFPVAGDLVEALVESGDLQAAGEVTDLLEQHSTQQEHPWGLATAARARALIAMARGDAEAAGAGLLGAASDYGGLGLEFEQARCLLALGRLHRRGKKRGEARRSCEEAIRRFDRLGCDGWAAQARAELDRVSGRRSTEETDLTPSERRVVDLVVSGLSNKEIARALYVSVSTVEAHLSHTYAKLGVSSRAQLTQRVNSG
jgi:DNA-binding CsgD family transcriptional regulator